MLMAIAAAFALSGCILLPYQDRHAVLALQGGGVMVGAWLGDWPSDEKDLIDDFEGMVGKPLDIVDVYLDWFTPYENVSHTQRLIAREGSIAMLTWEAQTLTTVDIIEGTKRLPLRDGRFPPLDDYLDEFSSGACRVARETQTPVFIRVLHEMNGNWFAWGITYEGSDGKRPNTDESYRMAWIKIHEAFRSKCASQVRFVWATNHFSVGEGAAFLGAYPGDDYVDFVGIDGYNWGDNADWGWQSFETLFRPAYCALTRATAKPILVAEIASSERGGDKAAWLRDFVQRLGQYDRIRGFVYLHDNKYEIEIRGEMDWPVDSSPASLEAFREGVATIHAARDAGARPAPPPGAGVVRCPAA